MPKFEDAVYSADFVAHLLAWNIRVEENYWTIIQFTVFLVYVLSLLQITVTSNIPTSCLIDLEAATAMHWTCYVFMQRVNGNTETSFVYAHFVA